MGQPRQHHLLMHLLLGAGHHQLKQFCLWGLSLLVPFLLLLCFFPSGTSLYRPPSNRIVVSQIQVPPSRPHSHHHHHHHTLPSDPKAEEKLMTTSSTDEPDILASKKAKSQSDGLLSEESKKQNVGIKAEVSRMDSSTSSSSPPSEKAGKSKMKKKYDGLNIKTLIDKELDEQANVEDIQYKRSKIKHSKIKISDTAIEEETFFFGEEDGNDDDEASAKTRSRHKQDKEEEGISSLGRAVGSHTARSRRGRKQDKEEEGISSLGKGTGENEEGPISAKSRSSKQPVNVIQSEVSFLGKEKTARQRSGKESLTEMGDGAYAVEEQASSSDRESDLLFLETADKEAFLMESPKKTERISFDDDDDMRREDHSIDVSFTSKQSEKCRYYEGRWIIDSLDPLYKDSTCVLMSIDDQEDCKDISNKTKPIRWRWQPNYCRTEKFKVKTFLTIMQRKSLAFIGDKLAKAQMQSLVCLLAQVEKPNLVYEDKTNKSTSWHFSSSNLTISMIWSPYLVQEVDENGYKKLHLDKLDTKWVVMVPTLDVIVLGIGSLFIEPTVYMIHDEVVGCYACKDLNAFNGKTDTKEISMYSGFRAVMRSSLMGVGALPGFEGVTLFLQPFGFEGNGSYHFVSMKMKEIQEEELYQAYKRGSISNKSKMEVLHTDFISMSKYDDMQSPRISTCLIPSPLTDTWNQFLHHTLARLLNHNSHT